MDVIGFLCVSQNHIRIIRNWIHFLCPLCILFDVISLNNIKNNTRTIHNILIAIADLVDANRFDAPNPTPPFPGRPVYTVGSLGQTLLWNDYPHRTLGTDTQVALVLLWGDRRCSIRAVWGGVQKAAVGRESLETHQRHQLINNFLGYSNGMRRQEVASRSIYCCFCYWKSIKCLFILCENKFYCYCTKKLPLLQIVGASTNNRN
jgi:hypothetical protein